MAKPLASIHESAVQMERFRFAFQQLLPDVQLRDAVSIESVYDHMIQGFAYKLRYEILGQQLEERVVEYPADWWQAFRSRWFPSWWLRRRPVRFEQVRMRLLGLYPQIPIDQRPVYHVDIGPVDG